MNTSDMENENSDLERPRPHCAEHRIVIQAPAEAVWKLVSDIEAWGTWNPLYSAMSGTLRVGEWVHFEVVLEGMKPRKGSARVVTVKPNELLEYGTTAFAGLVRASRYIEIREAGDGQCTVVNGEHMGGLLGTLLFRLVGEKVRRGMQAMNEALRKLAEKD